MRSWFTATTAAIALLACPTLTASAIAQPYGERIIGTPDLSSFYRLGETSGTVVYDSAGNANGAYNGAPFRGMASATTDTNPSTIFFNPTDNATFGDHFDFAQRQPFSIEFWVLPLASSTSAYPQQVIAKERTTPGAALSGWQFYLNTDNKPGFIRADGSGGVDFLVSATPLPALTWSHVAVTYDGSALRLYINGTLQASQPSAVALPDSTDVARIGGQTGEPLWQPFPGGIDDLAVFTSALSASTIADHFRSGRSLGSYPDAVLSTTALQSYWRLGDTGTSGSDSKGSAQGSYLGATGGAVDALADDPDRAAAFDGINDRVTFGDRYDFSGSQPFTVEFWLRPTVESATMARTIISKESLDGSQRQGWGFYQAANSGKLTFAREPVTGAAATLQTTGALSANRWYAVAATYDGTVARLYLDGQLQASASSVAGLPDLGATLTLGARSDSTEWWAGNLDEVAVYDSALTASQVAAHYEARVPFTYGIVANVRSTPGKQYDTMAANLAALGATSAREEINYDTLPLNDADWQAASDPIVLALAKQGISVLLLMNGSGSGALPTTDAERDRVAQATAKYVGRYGPHGTFWQEPANAPYAEHAVHQVEIWNEAYLQNLHPGTTADYGKLVRHVYNVAKPVDADVDYLIDADIKTLTPNPQNPANNDENPWLSALYQAVPDFGDHFDAVAAHPYTTSNAVDPMTCNATARGCFQNLVSMRSELDSLPGGRAKPIVITEHGNSTCPGPTQGGGHCVTEQVQADRLDEVFDGAKGIRQTMPSVDGYFLFAFWDQYGAAQDPDNGEYWFGLAPAGWGIESGVGDPKPAYDTYKSITGKG